MNQDVSNKNLQNELSKSKTEINSLKINLSKINSKFELSQKETTELKNHIINLKENEINIHAKSIRIINKTENRNKCIN